MLLLGETLAALDEVLCHVPVDTAVVMQPEWASAPPSAYQTDMEPDKQQLAALVERITAMEQAGAAQPGHADHWRRTELMDELQDAVGLAGRMVTDQDIMKRAGLLLRVNPND